MADDYGDQEMEGVEWKRLKAELRCAVHVHPLSTRKGSIMCCRHALIK